MKILLTGLPKSGKTTLLTNLIKNIKPIHGMSAQEIIENGQRAGFLLLDNMGRQTILADDSRPTNYPVGRFFVDISSLNSFCEHLVNAPTDALLYIDEIGHMQLYSEQFQRLTTSFLDSPQDYLGTISSTSGHPFIQQVVSRTDILLCTVTPGNREILQTILSDALTSRVVFNHMTQAQRRHTLELARRYLSTDNYISLGKLFRNALRYVTENRIKQSRNTYIVTGDHSKHRVHKINEKYQCDCDFYNGRGKFKGRAGECSHIQAIEIITPDKL